MTTTMMMSQSCTFKCQFLKVAGGKCSIWKRLFNQGLKNFTSLVFYIDGSLARFPGL